ncbi:hypothetical protein QTP88_019875 [Uroleucon formosanum]
MVTEKTVHKYIPFNQKNIQLSEAVKYVTEQLAKHERPKKKKNDVGEDTPLCFMIIKKINTRKIIAQNCSEVYKTEGGKIEAPAISTIDIEAILEVMNATSVNGQNNDNDDDQISNNEIFITKINTDIGVLITCGSNLQTKPNTKLTTTKNINKEWVNRRRPSNTPTGNVAKKFEEVAEMKKQIAEELLANLRHKGERDKEEYHLRKELLLMEFSGQVQLFLINLKKIKLPLYLYKSNVESRLRLMRIFKKKLKTIKVTVKDQNQQNIQM